MKSLKDSVLSHRNSEIFTPEIIKWLESEGFKQKKNDACCFPRDNNDEPLYEWENNCLFKHGGYYSGDWPISIYIFSIGIGVDIDYECGGNSSTSFWSFENYTFEEAYDEMVDYVNCQKNS